MSYEPIILTGKVNDYAGIRALLGVTEDEVGDADIEQTPHLPYVEGAVAEIVTDYADLDGVDIYYLKTGVMCWVAALLCRFLAGKAAAGLFGTTTGGLKVGDYQEGGVRAIEPVDYHGLAEDLAGRAAAALGSISTQVSAYTAPTMLLLAGPTRSGATQPETTQEWIDKILPDVVEWAEDEE